jgi:hypothetical protein
VDSGQWSVVSGQWSVVTGPFLGTRIIRTAHCGSTRTQPHQGLMAGGSWLRRFSQQLLGILRRAK